MITLTDLGCLDMTEVFVLASNTSLPHFYNFIQLKNDYYYVNNLYYSTTISEFKKVDHIKGKYSNTSPFRDPFYV